MDLKLPWYFKWTWFILSIVLITFLIEIGIAIMFPLILDSLWILVAMVIIGFMAGLVWKTKRNKYIEGLQNGQK